MISKKVPAPGALRCEVTAEGNADSLAPEFSGKYLLVECQQTHKDQPISSSKSAWLKDLNVFVPVAEHLNDKPESSVKLENISVIR